MAPHFWTSRVDIGRSKANEPSHASLVDNPPAVQYLPRKPRAIRGESSDTARGLARPSLGKQEEKAKE